MNEYHRCIYYNKKKVVYMWYTLLSPEIKEDKLNALNEHKYVVNNRTIRSTLAKKNLKL